MYGKQRTDEPPYALSPQKREELLAYAREHWGACKPLTPEQATSTREQVASFFDRPEQGK